MPCRHRQQKDSCRGPYPCSADTYPPDPPGRYLNGSGQQNGTVRKGFRSQPAPRSPPHSLHRSSRLDHPHGTTEDTDPSFRCGSS